MLRTSGHVQCSLMHGRGCSAKCPRLNALLLRCCVAMMGTDLQKLESSDCPMPSKTLRAWKEQRALASCPVSIHSPAKVELGNLAYAGAGLAPEGPISDAMYFIHQGPSEGFCGLRVASDRRSNAAEGWWRTPDSTHDFSMSPEAGNTFIAHAPSCQYPRVHTATARLTSPTVESTPAT